MSFTPLLLFVLAFFFSFLIRLIIFSFLIRLISFSFVKALLFLSLHERVDFIKLLSHVQVEINGVERHGPLHLLFWRELAVGLHIWQRLAVELKHTRALVALVVLQNVEFYSLVEILESGIEIGS